MRNGGLLLLWNIDWNPGCGNLQKAKTSKDQHHKWEGCWSCESNILHRSTWTGSQSLVCYTQLWAAETPLFKSWIPFPVVFPVLHQQQTLHWASSLPLQPQWSWEVIPAVTMVSRNAERRKMGRLKAGFLVLFAESSQMYVQCMYIGTA